MEAFVILADFAQVSDGKLNILGGGWTRTGPAPSNFGVAIVVKFPPSEANRPHDWRLTLVDADQELVLMPTPDEGMQNLAVDGRFETEAPPGLVLDEEVVVPIAFNFSNVPLPPGQRLMFALSIDGETQPQWTAAFSTVADTPPVG